MDYYSVLGVPKNASSDEIKKSYRKLASAHHPDKGGDTAKFQQIQEAYDTLIDPEKRAQYDAPRPHPNSNMFGFRSADMNFFDQIFKRHTQQRSHQVTCKTVIEIPLEEVLNGEQKIFNISINGQTHYVKIDIPIGVEHGQQLSYNNLIPNVTFIVEYRILPHHKFTRKGLDLYCNEKISVFDLIAGGKILTSTITGKTLEVEVKPKTQPGSILRIPSEGLTNQKSKGDHYIVLSPVIPDHIDQNIIDAINKHKDSN